MLVHQLSKHTTQNPFRKNRGRVVRVLFHPLKPFLFVATQNHVRVYNLAQQALAKKLIGGSGSITSMAIHSGGDHVIVGSEVGLLCNSPVSNECCFCVTIQAETCYCSLHVYLLQHMPSSSYSGLASTTCTHDCIRTVSMSVEILTLCMWSRNVIACWMHVYAVNSGGVAA